MALSVAVVRFSRSALLPQSLRVGFRLLGVGSERTFPELTPNTQDLKPPPQWRRS